MTFLSLISVRLGREAISLTELPGKTVGVLVVGLASDLGNRILAFNKLSSGSLKAQATDALGYGFSHDGSVNAMIVIGRQASDFR